MMMETDMTEFSGKTAIVTGGAQGMGREYVRLLADGGANVVIADVNSAVAQQTIEDLNAGNAVRFVHTDVSSIDACDACAASAAAPKATIPATFSVPARRPRSWPPPRMSGSAK